MCVCGIWSVVVVHERRLGNYSADLLVWCFGCLLFWLLLRRTQFGSVGWTRFYHRTSLQWTVYSFNMRHSIYFLISNSKLNAKLVLIKKNEHTQKKKRITLRNKKTKLLHKQQKGHHTLNIKWEMRVCVWIKTKFPFAIISILMKCSSYIGIAERFSFLSYMCT